MASWQLPDAPVVGGRDGVCTNTEERAAWVQQGARTAYLQDWNTGARLISEVTLAWALPSVVLEWKGGDLPRHKCLRPPLHGHFPPRGCEPFPSPNCSKFPR